MKHSACSLYCCIALTHRLYWDKYRYQPEEIILRPQGQLGQKRLYSSAASLHPGVVLSPGEALRHLTSSCFAMVICEALVVLILATLLQHVGQCCGVWFSCA